MANATAARDPSVAAAIKTESFDTDPGWDSQNNRHLRPDPYLVKQDFGFSPTNFAGKESGEIGGTIQRTITPAWYAAAIKPRILRDRLSASGSFSIPPGKVEGTLHFGWFNSKRQGWRPWSAIGFRLTGSDSHAEIYLDYMTQTWKAGGAGTESKIDADGAKHTWTLDYDPNANKGNGALAFTLDGGEPVVANLAPGHKADGAIFDRFGIFNQQTPGGSITAYFDDLQYDGKQANFSEDPGWDGEGNRVEFRETRWRGAQDYGFSPTDFAGGEKGELGGLVWRANPGSEEEGYYADRVGPLTLQQPLVASGKIALRRAATDGDLHFGWFKHDGWNKPASGADRTGPPFLGITIGGPAWAGHFFRPTYATALEPPDQVVPGYNVESAPRILPDGKSHRWIMKYDPTGNGTVTVILDGKSAVLKLEPGVKDQKIVFDRFGLFTMRPDGHSNDIYFDDLRFTASQEVQSSKPRRERRPR